MNLNEENIEILKNYETILNKFRDSAYGYVDNVKLLELREIYKNITGDTPCKCNKKWLNRLSIWYFNSKEEKK